MVFDKVSLSPLIFLFLATSAFAADVGIDFTLANAPPTVNLTLQPLSPAPGTITFESNATYYDLEMQAGTVNFTWYVGAVMAQVGGFYPVVAPGSTVTALPFLYSASGGQTVMACVDVSDGTNPPISRCTSTNVLSAAQLGGQPLSSLDIAATGGRCALSPIRLTFTRTGTAAQSSFNLLVRHPDGSIETIFMEATRQDYLYVPEQGGSYYFTANLPGCTISGTEVRVGSITPVLHVPVCSFEENAVDHTIASTGNPVTVYIVDNSGVAQRGTINVSWYDGNRMQSTSQTGASLTFVPSRQALHRINVATEECTANIEFTPNTCLGNQTNETVIKYEMENKTFYLWLLPAYMNATRTCSPLFCNMTADCCQGYCLEGKCVIPAAPQEPWIRLRSGCYGILECTDRTCEFLCNLMWMAVIAMPAYAAYLRRKYRQEAALLFLLPLAVALILFPVPGIVAAVAALAYAIYRCKGEEEKKKVHPEKAEK